MDNEKKAVLVAVSDIFFYTKIRDALLPKGYVLERIRTQDEVPAKAASLHPTAMILNMNDETLDAFKALEQMKGDASLNTIPILAFANHEEVETWRRARELGVNKIVARNEVSSRMRDLLEDMLSSQPSSKS